jgi:hypothetical protein
MILLYALKLLQKLLVLVISYSHQNIIDYAKSELVFLMIMELRTINKRARLVGVMRNKRKGIIIRAIEAPAGKFKCGKCFMHGRGCSINGKLCYSVAAELGLYSVMFIRV